MQDEDSSFISTLLYPEWFNQTHISLRFKYPTTNQRWFDRHRRMLHIEQLNFLGIQLILSFNRNLHT